MSLCGLCSMCGVVSVGSIWFCDCRDCFIDIASLRMDLQFL